MALEGPPLVGKSTLAQKILSARPDVLGFPDYVDSIAAGSVPAFDPGSSREQLEAFRRFMDIERARIRRVEEAHPRAVLLDRSVDTLLAHAYALDQIYGYRSYQLLDAELETMSYLRPDHTFRLRAPRTKLIERLPTRSSSAVLADFISVEFLRHQDRFYDSGLARSKRITCLVHESYLTQVPSPIMDCLP